MVGIGHNSGQSAEPGTSWRRHCWQSARKALLPTLPIEVVRLRVRRAAEIGLDYRTYASVRASTGHDVVAFLLSTNALRMLRPADPLPADRAQKLVALSDVGQMLAVQPPLLPEPTRAAIARAGIAIDAAARAPKPFLGWGALRRELRGFLAEARQAPDRVLLIGDTAAEREWSEAAGLAGYLAAGRYFTDQHP